MRHAAWVSCLLAVLALWPCASALGAQTGGGRNQLYAATVRVYSMGNPRCGEEDLFCNPSGGHGSGLAFLAKDESGGSIHVLTNAHVIDGGIAVAVEFAATEEKLPAVVVHADPEVDVAVLRVKVSPGFSTGRLKLVELADLPVWRLESNQSYLSDPLGSPIEPGTQLFVMGYGLESTQKAPEMRPANFNRWYELAGTDELWMQVSGGVNPGNSGGPACDQDGRFVGLVVAKSAVGEDIGFVIPSATVMRVVEAAFARLTPAMVLTTSSDQAYGAMARSTAHFLQHIEYGGKGDEKKAQAALESMKTELQAAVQADERYADCYMFLSWVLWRQFLYLTLARSFAEEGKAPELASVLPQLKQEQRKMLADTHELVSEAVRLNPDYVGEHHPSHTYVALVLFIEKQAGVLLGPRSGAETVPEPVPQETPAVEKKQEIQKEPEPPPNPGKGLDPGFVGEFEVVLNSRDEDMGRMGGGARLYLWYLHLTGGYFRSNNVFGHGAEDFLVDWAKLGLGGDVPIGRSVHLSLEAGYLGLGSSGYEGWFIGGRIRPGGGVLIASENRFLKSPGQLKGAKTVSAEAGQPAGLHDLYLKTDTLNFQSGNRVSVTLGSIVDLEATFDYREWSPTLQFVGGGRIFLGVEEFSSFIGGLIDKVDFAHPDLQDLTYKGFRLGFQAAYMGVTWPVEYQYWWSEQASSEHALITGLRLSL